MVFRNLIAKEMRQLRWVVVIGLLLNAGVAAVAVATFHYMGQVVEDIPAELFEALYKYDLTRELMVIFGDYSVYVWSQWNAKNFIQLASIFVIITSAVQFAGEAGKKTMGFYLTRPVNRKQGFFAKIAAGMLMLLIVFGGGTLIFWLASLIMGYTAQWGRLLTASFIGLIWALAYYSIACIISILFSEPVPAGVAAGVVGVLLSLPGMFARSRMLSIFHHMRAYEYFVLEGPLLPSLVSGLVLSGVLIFVGIRIFMKRDY